MKRLNCLISLIIIAFTSSAYAADLSSSFVNANEAYQSGDYHSAAESYETIIKEVKNADLYFNLGNSYFKQGKVGKALANYLRAKRYNPSDSDINDNIRYIRTLTKDKIEEKRALGFIYKIFFYYDAFSYKSFLIAFAAVNFILFLVLSIRLFYMKNSLNLIRNIIFILISLIAIGTVLNYKIYFLEMPGVVIKNEVSVRSGSSVNDTLLFNLHEGAEFRVIESGTDFVKIKLVDGKKGWVLKSVVEII